MELLFPGGHTLGFPKKAGEKNRLEKDFLEKTRKVTDSVCLQQKLKKSGLTFHPCFDFVAFCSTKIVFFQKYEC